MISSGGQIELSAGAKDGPSPCAMERAMARRRGLGERKPSRLLTDGAGRKIGEKIFKHSGEGLAEMAAWLLAAGGAAQPNLPSPSKRRTARGGNADQAWLHNPCYQSEADGSLRFTLAGAKDDSRDAEAMASALRTDPHCFRLLAALDPTVLELRARSRIASDLGAERNRLTNRLREQLWRCFPAMLELESDLGAP
jgi:hypothetical protein